MKKLFVALTAAMLVMTAPAFADDNRILFELGFGFGKASGPVKDKGETSKWCKHRNRGRMKYGAVRFQHNDGELHIARWTGDHGNAVVCDRDMWGVGLGYVLSTQDAGVAGRKEYYGTWTPGIAYVWGKDKPFRGKDDENTNWRQTGNFQVFNRLALGANGNDGRVELAVHRYGTFNPDHGENFVTVGLGLQDLEEPRSVVVVDDEREITPPPIINNITEVTEVTEVTETTNITIIDNTQGIADNGPVTEQVAPPPSNGDLLF